MRCSGERSLTSLIDMILICLVQHINSARLGGVNVKDSEL